MVGKRVLLRGAFFILFWCVLVSGHAFAENFRRDELIQVFDSFPPHFNVVIRPLPEIAIPAANIFVFLFRQNVFWEPEPYLVEGWTVSFDGLEYVFHIKEGTVFHDGKLVTSADVAFSIEAMKEYHPFGKNMFGEVESIETPDPATLVLKLSDPNPALIRALSCPNTPILPRHIYESENLRTNPANRQAVGSGPFKLVWYMPERGFILKRFEEFMVEDRPYLDRYIGLARKSQVECLDSVQSGEAHMATFVTDPDVILSAMSDDELFVTKDGYEAVGAVTILEMNLRKEILKNHDFRNEIVDSIDRSNIVGELYASTADAANSLLRHGSVYFDDRLNNQPSDPVLKILPDEDISLDPINNEEAPGLKVTWQPDRTGVHEKLAAYIGDRLNQLGIKAELENPETHLDWLVKISKWEHDLTIKHLMTWGDPSFGLRNAFHSDAIIHHYQANTSGINDPHVDYLLDRAKNEVFMWNAKKNYTEVFENIENKIAAIPLVEVNYHTVYNEELKGIPNGVWGSINPFDEIYWSDTTELEFLEIDLFVEGMTDAPDGERVDW